MCSDELTCCSRYHGRATPGRNGSLAVFKELIRKLDICGLSVEIINIIVTFAITTVEQWPNIANLGTKKQNDDYNDVIDLSAVDVTTIVT